MYLPDARSNTLSACAVVLDVHTDNVELHIGEHPRSSGYLRQGVDAGCGQGERQNGGEGESGKIGRSRGAQIHGSIHIDEAKGRQKAHHGPP